MMTIVTIVVLLCYVNLSDGQCYTDSVNIQQNGTRQFWWNRLAIIPRLNFTCNGRITSIRARVRFDSNQNRVNYPSFQVWRVASAGSTVYNKIGEARLQSDDQVTGNGTYRTANIILTGDDIIEFQSGDVVGYYHPPQLRYLVRNIHTGGYVLYRFDEFPAPNSINLTDRNRSLNWQPLVQFTIANVHCCEISTPAHANGEIILCSSSRVGVVCEGDTCSFTCNTGYKLTGSDTRTCQSDGKWNSSDAICKRVNCFPLTNPNNGLMINCSLRDDGIPSYEDNCSFTCNTGYELSGSDTRTCQSDGSWSGSNDLCRRVLCSSLTDSKNGIINCSLGDDGVLSYEDTCSFTCNTGYELTGSETRTCQRNGSWSGSNDLCRRVLCSSLTDSKNGIINCSLGDDGVPSYEDTCSFTCNTGYKLTGSDTRTCQNDGSWSGSDDACRKVAVCFAPLNGQVDCGSGLVSSGLEGDNCTFSCDPGYILQGSVTSGTCKDTGSFSEELLSCLPLNCKDRMPPLGVILPSSCNMMYQSNCTVSCDEGFTGDDVTYMCNVTSDSNMVDWVPIGGIDVMCEKVIASSSDIESGSAGAAIGGAVGGVVFFIIIVVLLVLSILLCIKYSRGRRKLPINTHPSTSRPNKDNSGVSPSFSNAMYHTAVAKSLPQPADYEEANFSYLITNVSAINESTEVYYELPSPSYEMPSISPYKMAESLEAEQQIYETPYEDEENYGPIYTAPSSDEQKIYEEFEGKRFHKLYHRQLKLLEELGAGEFGVVTHGKWTSSANQEVEVAVKTLNTDASDRNRLRFLQEAAIMCQFDHQNVIKLHGVVTETPAMIVLEYMARGDLQNMLIKLRNSSHPKLPIVLLKFCQEVAAGMAYLSGKQFVHRDLAARNILISGSNVCKIADFGMSRDLLDENYYITSGGKIPVKWTAPEALYYKKYSVYSDVWSYGCVLYEIWSLGFKPFEDMTNDEYLEKIGSAYRLPPPPGCPRAVYKLMMRCWNPKPRSRPQFGQVVKLLDSSAGYLLSWSDEDKQNNKEDALKLGNPLDISMDLFYDLQTMYYN